MRKIGLFFPLIGYGICVFYGIFCACWLRPGYDLDALGITLRTSSVESPQGGRKEGSYRLFTFSDHQSTEQWAHIFDRFASGPTFLVANIDFDLSPELIIFDNHVIRLVSSDLMKKRACPQVDRTIAAIYDISNETLSLSSCKTPLFFSFYLTAEYTGFMFNGYIFTLIILAIPLGILQAIVIILDKGYKAYQTRGRRQER